MADKITLSEREHPLYSENVNDWNLYLQSARGGRDFIEDNIYSHRLEDSTDYSERKERGYYLNFCDTLPTIYNSYIFQNNIERSADPNLIGFRSNVDGKGTSIDDFIKKVGYYSSIFGVCHVIVDMPAVKKKTNASVLSKADTQGISPFARIVLPTQLKDWSVDEFGNFNWVLIEYTYYRDSDPEVEREEEIHYKLITKENWKVVDEDGNPVKFEDGSPNQGPNTLGIVPIITAYHKNSDEDDKVGESMLKDIVYINIIVLNWCSLIDEQFARNCFSQLVIPDKGSIAEAVEAGNANPLLTVGNTSVFTFDGESQHPPQFISPDVKTITVKWSLVEDHIKEMYRLSGLLSGTSDLYAPQSGRASQFGFLSTNAALAEKALSYQNLENKMSKLAYLQLGVDVSGYENVKYPTSFDLESLAEKLDTLMGVMENNFSQLLNKTIQKDIVRKVVPLAPETVRDEIENEIDSGDGYVEKSGNTLSNVLPKDDGSGNPNRNKLTNGFRTNELNKKEESQHRNLDK